MIDLSQDKWLCRREDQSRYAISVSLISDIDIATQSGENSRENLQTWTAAFHSIASEIVTFRKIAKEKDEREESVLCVLMAPKSVFGEWTLHDLYADNIDIGYTTLNIHTYVHAYTYICIFLCSFDERIIKDEVGP